MKTNKFNFGINLTAEQSEICNKILNFRLNSLQAASKQKPKGWNKKFKCV